MVAAVGDRHTERDRERRTGNPGPSPPVCGLPVLSLFGFTGFQNFGCPVRILDDVCLVDPKF